MTETSVRLRAPTARSRRLSLSRARSVPTAVWLGAIVVVSAALRFALAAATPGPVIFTDEVIYSELAKSLAATGEFSVRDVPFQAWTYGPLYPALMAPVFSLQPVTAYGLAKTINCVLFSLAAVPAYFLARRLLDRPQALFAASLAVLIPSVAYSTRVMTESLAYPVFLAAVLALVACLERPTRRRQLLLIGTITLACLTRAQAIVLVPAFFSAAALLAILELRAEGIPVRLRALAGRLRAFTMTWRALLLVAATALVATAAQGRTPTSLLGAHEALLGAFRPLEVPVWVLYHAAGLDLVVGIVPFAAFLLLVGAVVVRGEHRRAWPFTTVSLAVMGWLLLMIGLYSTQNGQPRFHERYVFYVEPLLLISLVFWASSNATKATCWRTRVIVLAAALLPFALYFGYLFGQVWDAPGLAPWASLLKATSDGVLFLALAALAFTTAYLLLRRRGSPAVLLGAVALYVAATSVAASATFVRDSRASVLAGVGSGERAWIDRAIGPDANVAAVWSGRQEQWERFRTIWVSEFFNRSVSGIYYLSDVPFELAETPVRLRGGAMVLPDGRPLQADFVLSDGPVINGQRVASQPEVGLALYRVDGPVRLARGPK